MTIQMLHGAAFRVTFLLLSVISSYSFGCSRLSVDQFQKDASGTGKDGGLIGDRSENGKCVTGTKCAGICVDLASDPAHCGTCQNACPSNQVCSNARCGKSCGKLTKCSGACIDIKSDDFNCGRCGLVCTNGTRCVDGICLCKTGKVPVLCGEQCVDLFTDLNNCGDCGVKCPPIPGMTVVCSLGGCSGQCQGPLGGPPLTDCNGGCVDPQKDKQNCGACGNVCRDGASCIDGVCACTDATLAYCHGACVDLQTANLDCGGCNSPCPIDETCQQGHCVSQCADGLSACGNGCVNLMTDRSHCGYCDATCNGDLVCQKGSCSCPSPKTSCEGTCSDLSSDTANCGGCGKSCNRGQTCEGGTCQ